MSDFDSYLKTIYGDKQVTIETQTPTTHQRHFNIGVTP